MKIFITIVLKIILFPIALAMRILSIAINMLAGVSTIIAGPFCAFLLVMAVVNGIHQEWLHVGILSGLFVSVQLIYFCAAMITGMLQNIYTRWARI